MIPLKMRRLFFGFTPRRLLGINGSILAHCPSLNQNKFARICWPPIRLTNPLNLNMVNWVLTLETGDAAMQIVFVRTLDLCSDDLTDFQRSAARQKDCAVDVRCVGLR